MPTAFNYRIMENTALIPSKYFTREGLIRFLESPYIKGVGPVFARKLADTFSFDIIRPEFEPSSAPFNAPDIPERIMSDLRASLSNLKFDPEEAVLLYSAGLSDIEVEKILDHYGRNLLVALADDPYDMVENAWKVSFFTADKIGKILGIAADDPRRLRGALLTAVKYYAENGSLFASEDKAVRTAASLTGADSDKIKPEIETLVQEERLIRSYDGIYLPVYYNAEKETASKLIRLMRNAKPAEETTQITACTDGEGHTLNSEQIEAIRTVMDNPVTVITGGPGTGKTTAVRGILNMLEDNGRKAILVAPTGRAAKRLSGLAGAEATTIHRLLGYRMGRGYLNKRFDAGIIVIDEASMLEQVLFSHLLDAVDDNVKIVLVGDTDQLPAIGAGDVLNDMIRSGRVPVVRLTENFRQKAGSAIAATAENIRHGLSLQTDNLKDFILITRSNSSEILETVLRLVSQELPRDFNVDPKDIQVVSPQQDGPLGARQLNIDIQQRVNPSGPTLMRGKSAFRLGDRVMQTANSSQHNVYNGETGWISAVDEQLKILEVTFHDGKIITYGKDRLKELSLAYATTVHKLQGSETDYMVMILSSIHRNMLYRNLLYTGVSRAKKLCVLVGQQQAIETALSNESPARRNSNLALRLSSPHT